MSIIKDNAVGLENTFIYFLHEKSIFKEKLFKKLLISIVELGINKEYSLETITDLFDIYRLVALYFGCHHNKADYFEIKNYKEIDYLDSLDNLEACIFSYLKEDFEKLKEYEIEFKEMS